MNFYYPYRENIPRTIDAVKEAANKMVLTEYNGPLVLAILLTGIPYLELLQKFPDIATQKDRFSENNMDRVLLEHFIYPQYQSRPFLLPVNTDGFYIVTALNFVLSDVPNKPSVELIPGRNHYLMVVEKGVAYFLLPVVNQFAARSPYDLVFHTEKETPQDIINTIGNIVTLDYTNIKNLKPKPAGE